LQTTLIPPTKWTESVGSPGLRSLSRSS
jgi:hypothetical protein